MLATVSYDKGENSMAASRLELGRRDENSTGDRALLKESHIGSLPRSLWFLIGFSDYFSMTSKSKNPINFTFLIPIFQSPVSACFSHKTNVKLKIPFLPSILSKHVDLWLMLLSK